MTAIPGVAVALDVSSNDRIALASVNRSLLALICDDHAWTSLLTSAEDEAVGTAELSTALSNLLGGLGNAQRGAGWLQDFVVTRGAGSIASAMERAIDESIDDAFRESAGSLLHEYGDEIGTLTESGFNGFSSSAAQQVAVLLEDAQRMVRGSSAEGDLIKNILCSSATLLLVGGMVTTAVPPHVHGPIIAGVGISSFKAFGCRLDDLEKRDRWAL